MDRLRNWRLAWRRLRRERGFAVVAVLTLAIGIGANTAIFTLIDDVLLHPLAYPRAGQLVSIHESIPQFARQYPLIPVDQQSVAGWRQRARTLSALAIVDPETWDMTGAGEPRQIAGVNVTAGIFTVMGVHPRIGRDFVPADNQPHHNNVVILSHAFWSSQFRADPGVLGRIIELDGQADTVIGVMPAGFPFPHGRQFGPLIGDSAAPGPIQVFHPAAIDWSSPQLSGWNHGVFARLRSGVSAARAQAELQGIVASMPVFRQFGIARLNVVVTPLRDQIVGNYRAQLWLLLAAVAAILAIVCLNLANLLLVRIHGRGHENAIRLALGATPGRLLMETVTEGVLLALMGGAGGCGLAWAALRSLVAAAPAGVPRLDEVHLNAAALAFALALAVACGILFSLWPAWQAAATHPEHVLRAGGRGGGEAAGRMRVRDWLVGAQCALTAALLIVAGLLAASYLDLTGVSTGFQPGHLLTVSASWPAGNKVQRGAFLQSALQRLQALPGVRDAALTDQLPLQGSNDQNVITVPGDTRPAADRPLANFRRISPDYFTVMGTPLVAGRAFTDADLAAAMAPKVNHVDAIVSATMAARLWPRLDPIGRQFTEFDSTPTFTVIGVAGDVRVEHLETPPALVVYLPYTYEMPESADFALRAAGSHPLALAGAARAAIWSAQPAAAIPTVETMDSRVATSVASRRFQMMLVLAFAMGALLLAALGIYGVVSYTVARRAQEIGIRIALGAGAGSIRGMVFRRGLMPVFSGLIVGLAAALAAGRFLASQLYGVHAADPAVIVAVALTLCLAGLAACAQPAHRATRTDPLIALRNRA